ncbi:OmpH family outer membrane protein [Nannocystaceae bacterium ST9]
MTRMIRKLTITSLLGLAIFAGQAGASGLVSRAHAAIPEIGKIAVVDMQRVLNETSAGKQARKDLETASSAKQKKLDKLQKKFEEGQAKLGQLEGDALLAAQEKLQADYYELQSMYMTLQQELAEQESRTLEKMYGNCQTLAKDMAKELALDLVLIRDQSTVLFAAEGLDLTDEVIKRYDKKYE